MWRNDIKCKYMFMFTLKKLARKGLSTRSFFCMHMMNLCWTPPPFLLAVTTEQIELSRHIVTLQTNNAISAEAFIKIEILPVWQNVSRKAAQRYKGLHPDNLISIFKCIVLQKLERIWRRFSKHLTKGNRYYFSFRLVSNYVSLSCYHHSILIIINSNFVGVVA